MYGLFKYLLEMLEFKYSSTPSPNYLSVVFDCFLNVSQLLIKLLIAEG
jgi:hypothetical protein